MADVGRTRAGERRIRGRAESAVARGGEKARNETLDLRCGSFRLHEDDRLLRRRVRRRAGCGGRRSAAEEREGSGDGGEAAQDLHGVKVYACLPYPPVMETAAAPLDLLVVGAGPVGLACALEAARQGLSHVVIEKGALLDTLVNWPTHTIFFSTPELLEIGGHPFVTASGKPTRREGLVYYREVAERAGRPGPPSAAPPPGRGGGGPFCGRGGGAGGGRPAPSSWRPAFTPNRTSS